MAKDRIIIADEDAAYLTALRDVIAEELFDLVDLELFSERACFEKFLSEPQEAAILIISESLFSPAAARQRTGRAFLLTEEQPDGTVPGDGILRICRYAGIRDIWKEILGCSEGILKTDRQLLRDSRILAVTSASGGVGKTTVALGLCAALAKMHRKVLYLDTGRLQTFRFLLNDDLPAAEEEIYVSMIHPGEALYAQVRHCFRGEDFLCLPPLRVPQMVPGIRADAWRFLAQGAKQSGDFDFIIMDTDSVFDEEKARLLELADRAVIVTEQTAYHVQACSALAACLADTDPEKYIYICNKYDERKYDALSDPGMQLQFVVQEYVHAAESYEAFRESGFTDDEAMRRAVWLLG